MQKNLGRKVDAFFAIGHDTGSLICQVLSKNKKITDFLSVLKKEKFHKMLTTRELSYTKDLLPKKDFYVFELGFNKIQYWGEFYE